MIGMEVMYKMKIEKYKQGNVLQEKHGNFISLESRVLVQHD